MYQPFNGDIWDNEMLNENFNGNVCTNIHIVLGNVILTEGRDKSWQMPCGAGTFIVGTSWELCRQRKDLLVDVTKIWEKGLSFKVSFMLWRMWFGRIPIGEVLVKRKIADFC